MSNTNEIITTLFEIYHYLKPWEPNVVDHFISRRIISRLEDIREDASLISECESPIERLLCISLMSVNEGCGYPMDIFPQWSMPIKGKTYRADFIIRNCADDDIMIAVECDGHDFHEKTKEQAAKDKARDRAFQSKGIPIIHFTGSEIFKNPGKCANEVLDLLSSTPPRKKS